MILESGSPGPPSQLCRFPFGSEPGAISYRMVRIIPDLLTGKSVESKAVALGPGYSRCPPSELLNFGNYRIVLGTLLRR
jgi:hypothetical protein